MDGYFTNNPPWSWLMTTATKTRFEHQGHRTVPHMEVEVIQKHVQVCPGLLLSFCAYFWQNNMFATHKSSRQQPLQTSEDTISWGDPRVTKESYANKHSLTFQHCRRNGSRCRSKRCTSRRHHKRRLHRPRIVSVNGLKKKHPAPGKLTWQSQMLTVWFIYLHLPPKLPKYR